MASFEKFGGRKAGPLELWLKEAKATLLLGLPLIGAQLAQMAINVTDTVMIGWLGADQLAAAVLANQLYYIVWLAGLGLVQAVMPLASQAAGQGDVRGVRRAARMGMWIALGFSTLGMGVLWQGEQILLLLGQDPNVSALAGEYLRILQWSIYPSLFVMAVRSFLTSLERAQIVLWATVISALFNAVLDYAFIFGKFGMPEMGIVGAGVASVGTNALAAVILIWYVLNEPTVKTYEVFVRFWRADWGAFFETLRLGWPYSLALVAETGLFSAAAFMMGWFGTLEVAAHGIVAQLAGLAFMIPIGFSNATVVRVGLALGRKDAQGIMLAGWCSILMAMGVAVVGASLFWLLPEIWIGFYLDQTNPNAAAVLALGVPLLVWAAAFQVFDGIQVVAAGALRGLSDTRTPMIIAFIGYWVIGIPMSYVLAFKLGFGPEGIWIGLAGGLAASAAMLTWRFYRRRETGLECC
ncbi:MATE family efflux transporter [Rhodobacteraceae bacterium RKSG542]|uniref:MATE family efflux transporter n=1 Tax=Pseudovibrio flavus TaxID=2529854 RepID=UPI0012BD3429|nr:MATE family efflux transporter [Pseudovibrio flavus]MTI16564.1 MATE family efflux transporter [Pseudovibrio flavus]